MSEEDPLKETESPQSIIPTLEESSGSLGNRIQTQLGEDNTAFTERETGVISPAHDVVEDAASEVAWQ